jgi:hypothetical protein
MYDLVERWRQEATDIRTRHGMVQNASALESVARDLECALDDFFSRSFGRADKAFIAELTGYSDRHVERLLTGQDGTVMPNLNGEVTLLDLPVKAGHLAKVFGLSPTHAEGAHRTVVLEEERARRRPGWSKQANGSATGN